MSVTGASARLRHLQIAGWSKTMFHRGLWRIPTIPSQYEHDLAWSLQPMSVWLQMLAIPSGRFHLCSTGQRRAILAAGMVIIVWMVTSRIRIVSNYVKEVTLAASWTGLSIDQLNLLQGNCNIVLISASLLIGAHCRWESLWKKACQIEEMMTLDATFYRSIRRTSWTAILLLLLVNQTRIWPSFSWNYCSVFTGKWCPGLPLFQRVIAFNNGGDRR